ncbi:MAG: helicase-related protein [Gemmatimonadota bacterium]
MPRIEEDEVITAPFLAGPARVKKFEERRGFFTLEVTLEETGQYRALQLSPSQVDQIEVTHQNPAVVSSDPEEFFLLVEAHRIRLAHQFDPMLAVSVSQVDPLPHQIEAVYHYALEQPRMRFLIADDPGAGKTIMAGLILREMQARRLVRRVLVVAPGHLKYQWQRELKEKFGVRFRLIDRNTMRAAWGENVWVEHPFAITSIDFLKQDDVKATLHSADWDLVVVDEAHKMSAYAYETSERTKIDKTKRYQAGEVLARNTDHLLFLTATPHRGDDENFRLFLDLLRPGFFAQTDLLRESVERGDNPVFVRRLKEDMKTFEGRDIFPPRNVVTLKFKMTDPETELYNSVTRYVQHYYDQAKEKRHITFAMLILQRRLTSSVHAILSSLERRREKLEEWLHLPEKIRDDERFRGLSDISDEEMEELAEADRWAIEERLEQITIAENIDDVREEVTKLEELIEMAKGVRSREIESKLVKLRDEILTGLGDEKLLIFTEHRDTLRYLKEKLEAWGYDVCEIHGGMDLDARIEAEQVFCDRAQVMVATEAAGEGINLQFCHQMVNYDIPWNPNRLEQRMGRIHRYGQNREVFIWNLVSRDTREGDILDRLFEKLARMRKALGTDRVFDIIGEVIPGTNLSDLLRDAVVNARRIEEIYNQIEAIQEDRTRATMDRVFMTSLATRHIDYTGVQREALAAEENRLVPEYVEDFFLRGFRRLDGRLTAIENGYRVESVPLELRRRNEDYAFTTQYGKVAREYRRITFEKGVARKDPLFEFVAPGHPLLEALNDVILTEFRRNASEYAVFEDPERARSGALWFIEGEVSDGSGDPAGRRVFALLQREDRSVEHVNPAVLWDLEPAPMRELPPHVAALLSDRTPIEDYLIGSVLLPYREEVQERRARDAEIKRRYGLRSLDYLIGESNGKILDYELRADAGESMDIVIRNERARLDELQRRREDLVREIELEANLAVSEPKVLGVAAVLPAAEPVLEAHDGEGAAPEGPDGPPDGMHRDDEIEAVGMRVARAYEEAEGRTVEDVSAEAHGGFDLRSLSFDDDGGFRDVRYIEVKARSRTGAIRLTANEWKKARHFGDQYWLYVVTGAGSDEPTLERIRDPARAFIEDEDIFATGFLIPEDRWRTHRFEHSEEADS